MSSLNHTQRDDQASNKVKNWSFFPKNKEPVAGIFILTENNMGVMLTKLDKYSAAFVEYAIKFKEQKCLEIGAAYGVATIPALQGGAHVIANDICSKHLEILAEHVKDNDKARLELMLGKFPDEINFPLESLQAVLVSRVFHFFTPEELTLSSQKLFNWLTPGGKIFVVVETPYVGLLKPFIKIFEENVRRKEKWPGFIPKGARDYIIVKEFRERNPDTIHLLDIDTLTRVFIEAGFVIENAGYIARDDWPVSLQYDGRESCGLIAHKL